MQGDAHGSGAGVLAQIDVEGFGQLGDGGFAGAVGIPAAGGVVGDGADAGGHEGEDGGGWQVGVGGEGGAAFGGEEGREVFEQEEWPERVDFERGEGVGVRDGGGRFLRVQDAGDAEGETERGRRESRFAMRRCGGDGIFVCKRFPSRVSFTALGGGKKGGWLATKKESHTGHV